MGYFLIWLLVFAVFGGCTWWQVRDNKQLAAAWRSKFDPALAEQLVRFAWTRTTQLLFILACFLIVILIYNSRLSEKSREVADLTKLEKIQQEAQQKEARQQAERQALAIRQPVAQPRPVEPAAQPAPAQPAPAPVASQQPTIEDVYNPERNSRNPEAMMDTIKKRYEGILVTYMFMKQCGKAGTNDYAVIISALAQEMASVNAPGRMQYDIVTAAQGSYKEIYSRSRCDDPGMNTLTAQYANYIKALAQNIAAH